jgi:hypothetical protein
MRKFPRKIVLTQSYGNSFFSNLESNLVLRELNPYDVIESEALVQACEEGLRWEDAKDRLIQSGFPLKHLAAVDHWGWERKGVLLVEVVEVKGPYIVENYDGFEYVIEKDAIKWRD